MENDKDIKIEFICLKDDKLLLNKEKKLPAIYVKESYYSLDNIEYYLNMYLNSKVSNLKKIEDNFFSFNIDKKLDDFDYYMLDEDSNYYDLIKKTNF